MEILKNLFYRYKDWMRDVGVFVGEYSTAGRFVNEGLAIMTYLAVKGYNIAWWQGIGIYLLGLFLMGLLGKVLIWLKVPHYTQTLGNQMNPELMKILEQQEEILKILKKK